MSEKYELGSQFREFLRGMLDDKGRGIEWGPRVNLTGLKDNFKGTKVKPYTVTPGGIDNLALHSTDVFTVPGKGEFSVDFSGYFRVARDHATTKDWTTFELLVNIVDLRLNGQSKDIGEITVSLNPDVLSSGQIFPATSPQGAAKCRIATGVIFDLPQLGLSVFNKEPILLMNEHVTSIPPVDDPNGHALLFMLPLFDRANASGKAVAFLTSLRYGADNYITEAQAKSFQAAKR
ncbi:MAG: DUF6073 family protein [Acidobacteriota bacterium]